MAYMLELSEEELTTLWCRLMILEAKNNLDDPERQIYEKVKRLMEGK